tara:strand:- start:348 stop:506 length:159 start_codon:yes stop_codon:yes gene_type:complete
MKPKWKENVDATGDLQKFLGNLVELKTLLEEERLREAKRLKRLVDIAIEKQK